jgi:hypothetical protein
MTLDTERRILSILGWAIIVLVVIGVAWPYIG